MPQINIKMYPGRSEELKQEIATETRDFLAEKLGMEKKYFTVTIEDVPAEKWQEEVVDATAEDTIYVKADY